MKLTKEQKQTAGIIGFGIVLLLIGFLLDSPVDRLRQLVQYGALTYIFKWISYILSLILILLFMTSMFMWEENKKDWIIPLWSSTFLALVITYILKIIVARERPETVVEIFGINDPFSFPSAHAAISFAAVPILDKEFPSIKAFWIVFAIMVAISRIYLGAHFLTDVIAGALIGYIIGKTIIYIKEKYNMFL